MIEAASSPQQITVPSECGPHGRELNQGQKDKGADLGKRQNSGDMASSAPLRRTADTLACS